MFTGIVDHCGEITDCQEIPAGILLRIRSDFKDLVLGESIAVDGICLTVTEIDFPYFCCALSPETCEVTTAKKFKHNPSHAVIKVNLERAVRATERLGGHIVMGHVDTIARITSKENQGDFLKVHFQLASQDKSLLPYFVKKGSVVVNGVSLTINEVLPKDNIIEVMLIPHTLLKTNLGLLNIEDQETVNIEYDYFARYIVNYLKQMKID